MASAETVLYRSAATWTGIGLVSGIAFREITRNKDFDGTTELAFLHTHALALGTLTFLIVLTLERVFNLSSTNTFRAFVWSWNIGLAITLTMMSVIGYLQVQGSERASSPALAGIAGLGHLTLTVGFLALFSALGTRIRRSDDAQAPVASTSH